MDEVKVWYKSLNKEFNEEDFNKIANKPYSIIKVVDLSILNSENFSTLATVDKSMSYTYKTFIPDPYAKDPWYNPATWSGYIWGNKVAHFSGDNRGFSYSSDQYRTKTWGKTIFYSGSASERQFSKNISSTHAYDKDYKHLVSLKALDTYVNEVKNSHTSNQSDYTVHHKVGNPFAIAGGEIDYSMQVKFWDDGSYSFVGLHDRAPSHELYPQTDGSYRMIFAHPNEGFEYLGAPSTLARTFNISN